MKIGPLHYRCGGLIIILPLRARVEVTYRPVTRLNHGVVMAVCADCGMIAVGEIAHTAIAAVQNTTWKDVR